MRSFNLILILGVLWTLIGRQCGPSRADQPVETPAFHPLVTAFTSGLVSAESGVVLRFAQDLPDSMAPGTRVDRKVMELSPAVEGELYYLDRRTIEFRPRERLPRGVSFRVRVKPGRLFPDADQKSVFEFGFHVIAQHMELAVESFRPYSDYHPELNYITGSVQTADVAEPTEVELMLYAVQQDRKPPVSWEHSPDGKLHRFVIDSIARGESEDEVAIHYDGSLIGAEQKGVKIFRVPSLGEFRVISHHVVQYPEQHVVISFSDPIRKQQYLQGLIRLETETDLRFGVEGNNILVYPVVRQNGTMDLFIEPGIRNTAGKGLPAGTRLEVVFEQIQPAVEILGTGVIIPHSDRVLLPFRAVNLKAVDVKIIRIFEDNIAQFLQVNPLSGNRELKRAGRLISRRQVDLTSDRSINYGSWNTFSLDLTGMVEAQPGAIYRVEIGFRRQHSLFPCPDEPEPIYEVRDDFDAMEEGELSYWDSYEGYYGWEYDYYYDGFQWEDREDPCKPAYYGSWRSASRNVLASNLGMIAKKGTDGRLLVTVTDLLETDPLENVNVRVFNFQQQLMAEGTTGVTGTVSMELAGEPFLVSATRGEQHGYLKLNDGSALSLSMFDVAGSQVRRGLKAFIYGERGVWRPGDSLFIHMILDDSANPLPEGHPVSFEMKDPQGRVVSRHIARGDGSGFYAFRTATRSDAPTGRYSITAEVGGVTFDRLVRVETIKPNRLKIDLSFREDTLFPDRGPVRGTISSHWLTGAKARALKAEVEVIMRPLATVFKGYEGYTFQDPGRELGSQPVSFFSGSLDQEGKAFFSKDLEISGRPPGMLSAIFTTRVFERSGDFSIDQKRVTCSPYGTYVGIRVPAGDQRGMLLTDTIHTVRVVTLDHAGNPVTRVGLRVNIYKLDWRWWWESSSEDLSSYVGSIYNRPVYSTTITTTNGAGSFNFRIEYPDWGRYLVQVSNGETGHSAGEVVYVDWPGWAGRARTGDPDAAAILTFSTDKESYEVNDEIFVTIPSSTTGRLMISLENGSKVLRQEWLEFMGTETRYSFKATPEMTPNIFLYATLLQPYGNPGNDLPIRMFGVIPVSVMDPETILEPVIEMPGTLSPNSRVEITVSEAARRPMTYTLALVDEGLLDLTRFETPDPWQSFFAREALGVKTWDLFDDVLGAYGGRIDGVYNIGGGEDEGGPGAREANRFPPMVKFIGPYTLSGKSRTHTIEVPNYIGSVRTMLVAGHRGAYGSAERTTPVKQPLMVLATLPRVLGPGEEVTLPVNVFVMEDRIRAVDIRIETGDLLIAETTSGKVTFEGQGDRIVEFRLRCADRTGIARVKVEVTSGRERATHEIELEVRSPNPPVTRYTTAVLEPGSTMERELEYAGMPGTNSLELEVSSIPPVDFGRRLKFLTGYPHGCIEQTVSAVFPQLFLPDVIELDERMEETMEANIKAGIGKLPSFQLSDGSFSFWPGSGKVSEWGTSYAGHFMVEAMKKGYDVPGQLVDNWKRYQRREARRWSPAGQRTALEVRQEQLLQSYRLYTLALAGDPEQGAMNRMRERPDLKGEARWRLAAAYALAGQRGTALELVEGAPAEVEPYQDSRVTFGSGLRDMAMILESMVLMDLRDRAVPVMEEVAAGLSGEGWMSTQTTAYGLIAMARFTGGPSTREKLRFGYRFNDGERVSAETGLPVARVVLEPATASRGRVSVENRTGQLIYLRVINTGIPLPGRETAISQHLSVDVAYLDMENRPIEAGNLPQGTDFKAVYTITNPGTLGNLEHVALTTIFPSGWEIHHERLFGTTGETSPFEYQDIRDDRVMTYFGLPGRSSVTCTVRLNAAYAGRFYLPSVLAEEMYRNDVQVLVPGMWTEVEPRE